MKYILILFTTFTFGQQLDLVGGISGPFITGIAQTDINLFTKYAGLSYTTKGYNNFTSTIGHSELFGDYFSTNYYNNKLRLSVGMNYYYFNRNLPVADQSWGPWFFVSKKIKLWKKK